MDFDLNSEVYHLISYPTVDNSRTVYIVRFGEGTGCLAYSSSNHMVDIFCRGKRKAELNFLLRLPNSK